MKRWMQAFAALMLLVGFIAPTTYTAAQDVPKGEDEKKTEAESTIEDGKFSVPFENLGGLMFVKVKINDKGPYDFLFDSGAQVSVISKRLADELQLETADMPGGGMQGVGTAEAKAAVVESFDIGAFKRGKSGCASLDMDHISGGLGRHMMGIIGQNVMKQMKTIVVDFSKSTIGFEMHAEEDMPSDMTEGAIIAAVEGGGGGIPGLPFPLPGQPKEPKKQPEKPKKEGEKEEDEFSLPDLQPTNYFLQDGTETKPAHSGPREGATLTYTTGELKFFGRKLELTPFWHVEAVINGKARRFMFDTGANGLVVLSDSLISELKLPTSFSFTVKGISEGTATVGVLDSFELGSVKETDVAFMGTALPKITDQLGPLAALPGVDALDFDGIVGIDYAHRFKTMTVNTVERTLRFDAYADKDTNDCAPFEGEEMMKSAALRTWNGKAGYVGLEGDSIPLADWEAKGLKTGGMLVESVEAEGAAAAAGLKEGDILTHLIDAEEGEQPLRDLPELIIYACLNDPGSEITVRFKRGEEVKETRIKLTKYLWDGAFPERFKDK